MIRFLADAIDQLDLALDQLAIRDRNFDRFALMLVDNVVELVLHHFARDRAAENGEWGRLLPPKHDPQEVERALGPHFDAKVRFAGKLGLIRNVESFLNLHSFRNTTYHQGVRHERILHSLTLFYFRVACDLLAEYKPRIWSWGSDQVVPHRAAKYLGDVRRAAPWDVFGPAYQRLKEVAASMDANLVADLAADMEKTIESTDGEIEFLSVDSPNPMTRKQVVLELQAWPLASTPEGKAFVESSAKTSLNVFQSVEILVAGYKFAIRNDPIRSWRARHSSLVTERNEHAALKKYCDFMEQTRDF